MIDYSLYSLESTDELTSLAYWIKDKAELEQSNSLTLAELANYLAKIQITTSEGNNSIPSRNEIILTKDNSVLELKSDLQRIADIIKILSGYTGKLNVFEMAYLIKNFSLGINTTFYGQRVFNNEKYSYSLQQIEQVIFKVYKKNNNSFNLIGSQSQYLNISSGGCGDEFTISIGDVTIYGDDITYGYYQSFYNQIAYISLSINGTAKGKNTDIFKIEVWSDPSYNGLNIMLDSFEVQVGEQSVSIREEIPVSTKYYSDYIEKSFDRYDFSQILNESVYLAIYTNAGDRINRVNLGSPGYQSPACNSLTIYLGASTKIYLDPAYYYYDDYYASNWGYKYKYFLAGQLEINTKLSNVSYIFKIEDYDGEVYDTFSATISNGEMIISDADDDMTIPDDEIPPEEITNEMEFSDTYYSGQQWYNNDLLDQTPTYDIYVNGEYYAGGTINFKGENISDTWAEIGLTLSFTVTMGYSEEGYSEFYVNGTATYPNSLSGASISINNISLYPVSNLLLSWGFTLN